MADGFAASGVPKHFGFLVLHDGTFFKPIQVVYEEKLENFQEISKMNVGAAVIVEENAGPTPQAKQPFEIQAATVTLEGEFPHQIIHCRRNVTA